MIMETGLDEILLPDAIERYVEPVLCVSLSRVRQLSAPFIHVPYSHGRDAPVMLP
jgi:hypothetical protein